MSKAWPVSWARSWAFWLCESLLVTWVYKMNNKPLVVITNKPDRTAELSE